MMQSWKVGGMLKIGGKIGGEDEVRSSSEAIGYILDI
jgi:hypothetical protein